MICKHCGQDVMYPKYINPKLPEGEFLTYNNICPYCEKPWTDIQRREPVEKSDPVLDVLEKLSDFNDNWAEKNDWDSWDNKLTELKEQRQQELRDEKRL